MRINKRPRICFNIVNFSIFFLNFENLGLIPKIYSSQNTRFSSIRVFTNKFLYFTSSKLQTSKVKFIFIKVWLSVSKNDPNKSIDIIYYGMSQLSFEVFEKTELYIFYTYNFALVLKLLAGFWLDSTWFADLTWLGTFSRLDSILDSIRLNFPNSTRSLTRFDCWLDSIVKNQELGAGARWCGHFDPILVRLRCRCLKFSSVLVQQISSSVGVTSVLVFAKNQLAPSPCKNPIK